MKFKFRHLLVLLFLLLFLPFISQGQIDYKSHIEGFNLKSAIKKHTKFATIYGAVNGGTSKFDVKTFSVTSGELQEDLVKTPYDYSLTLGIRKIARFGYENRVFI